MTVYGYARTSTVDQIAGLEDQVAKLKAAGCTDNGIYREHVSAVKMEDRKAFAEVMAKLGQGDVLVITSISRIARSIAHMAQTLEVLKAKGASIRILDLSIDTSTPNGELVLNVMTSIAQYERQLMLERQKVGIAAAKVEGKYKGRAPTAKAKADKVLSYAAKGLTKQEIADACGIGVASVYRILAEAKQVNS